MQIEQIVEPDLQPRDEALINQLLEQAFADDYGGRSYYQQRPLCRFLIRQDGDVIGHLALMYRAVRLGGRLHTIMGIAEVAVAPVHQGKGIAKALVTAGVAQAQGSQATFAMLFGDHPLYTACGFRSYHNAVTYLDLSQAGSQKIVTAAPDGLMVLPLSDAIWNDSASLDLLGPLF